MIHQINSKLGCVGSKTMSPTPVREKLCEHTRGHIFSRETISRKLFQNVWFGDLLENFKTMSHWWKKMPSTHISGKSCLHTRGHVFALICMKLSQRVCFVDLFDWLMTGLYLGKNLITSLGHWRTFCTPKRSLFCPSLNEANSKCLFWWSQG